jgi:hypothetical protein
MTNFQSKYGIVLNFKDPEVPTKIGGFKIKRAQTPWTYIVVNPKENKTVGIISTSPSGEFFGFKSHDTGLTDFKAKSWKDMIQRLERLSGTVLNMVEPEPPVNKVGDLKIKKSHPNAWSLINPKTKEQVGGIFMPPGRAYLELKSYSNGLGSIKGTSWDQIIKYIARQPAAKITNTTY